MFDRRRITNVASFPVLPYQLRGLNPRPCDTEAFGRGTAPMHMRIGHAECPGKSDIDRAVASNHHMAFVIDFTEFTSETSSSNSKTPGHIANPVSLIIRCFKVGLMRHGFNTSPEFNTSTWLLVVAIYCACCVDVVGMVQT